MTIAATTTVGEIAAGQPNTTREFEKLGIDYCCGGSRTLGEACAQVNIPLEVALQRLESAAATAGQSAEAQDWQNRPLAELVAYIVRKHHAFVREETRRIAALTAKVVGVHGQNHPELREIQEVFSSLAEELSVHLMKEEQVLFPYLNRLEECYVAGEPAPPAMFGTVINPVRMMMQEHDGAGEALRALRSLSREYAIPDDACASYRTLYQALQEFEADLHQHIHLENNILFPRAVAMEAKR
ncbi:MAG TPA: iron-sulfur cluster repair di-iron protein [Candidatus Binatia bacterium]|nr:iron-sulfur cluster repair di-iron protein [Candidatus Binatia bacterium]